MYSAGILRQELLRLPDSAGLCLDVGCGPGDHLSAFVGQREYEGIGLDPLKESSLRVFKDRIKGSKISEKIELVKGVSEYLPINKDCIQLCFMIATLDHVYNPQQTLKEIYRVLVHNGYFLLLQSVVRRKKWDYNDEMHLHEFRIAELKKLLNQFTIEKIRRWVSIPSQIPIPEKLLNSPKIYKILSTIHNVIARHFKNYSVVIIKSRKN